MYPISQVIRCYLLRGPHLKKQRRVASAIFIRHRPMDFIVVSAHLTKIIETEKKDHAGMSLPFPLLSFVIVFVNL